MKFSNDETQDCARFDRRPRPRFTHSGVRSSGDPVSCEWATLDGRWRGNDVVLLTFVANQVSI
jgi:hypothetical protein